MLSQLSPALNRVTTEVKPEDIFFKKGSWVQFSPKWSGDQGWAAGNAFQVVGDPIVVTFPMSYIIPGNDYVDVNLANLPSGFTTTVLNLYPSKKQVLYQAGVGISQAEFLVQVGIPAAQQYVYRLGQSFMYPIITDSHLKYLGEKTWRDSPIDTPLLFFYFLYNMPFFFLRIYALEGKAYEKCTINFYINKCELAPLQQPLTVEQKSCIPVIPWYEELTSY